MFTIIGNISGMPAREDLAAINAAEQLGTTDKNDLSKVQNFVDLRYSCQNKAMQVMQEETGIDVSNLKNVNAPGFQRVEIPQSVVDRLAEILAVRKPMARMQVLEPGNMMTMHCDDLATGYMRPIEASLIGKVEFTDEEQAAFDEDNYYAIRFLIMMEDWQWGQGMMFNDQTFTHWKAGDVLYWDWTNVAHSTFNSGYIPRGLFRLTGLRTELTTQLVNDGLNGKPFSVKF
jgi:hypothetical protein